MTINNFQYRGGNPGIRTSVRNEKGVALVMVLILAAIALLIMAGLLYMITSSTLISGMQKKYKTALDAGFGGTEVFYQFIALQGNLTETTSLQTLLSSINPVITIPGGVSGSSGCRGTLTTTNLDGTTTTETYYGLKAKLLTPSTSWTNCDDTVSIDPSITCTTSSCSYDMRFDLGVSPNQYRIYAKIVDTVDGNSAIDIGLGGESVVNTNPGSYAPGMPYLYTMEMHAQAVTNPSERAKLSILYQY